MFPKWRSHSSQMREILGKSAAYAPWTSTHVMPAGLVDRQKDLLDLAWAFHKKQQAAKGVTATADLAKGFFADVGQAVQRRPWTYGTAPCLLQGSVIYSFEGCGFMSAQHHLAAQGHPKSVKIGTLTSSKVKGLTGEGFFAPCIASCIFAAYLLPKGPWWLK
jgi:hypothetical protein